MSGVNGLEDFIYCSAVYSKNLDKAIDFNSHLFDKSKVVPWSSSLFFTKIPNNLFNNIKLGYDFFELSLNNSRVVECGDVICDYKDFMDYGNYCLTMPGRFRPESWDGDFNSKEDDVLVLYWGLAGFCDNFNLTKNCFSVKTNRVCLDGVLKLDKLENNDDTCVIQRYSDVSSLYLK